MILVKCGLSERRQKLVSVRYRLTNISQTVKIRQLFYFSVKVKGRKRQASPHPTPQSHSFYPLHNVLCMSAEKTRFHFKHAALD